MAERLTFTQEFKEANDLDEITYIAPEELIKWEHKLSAYEDTGFEPSEVVDTVKLLQDVATKYETSVKINSINTGLLNKAQEELEAYRALGTVEELAALKEDNDGRN